MVTSRVSQTSEVIDLDEDCTMSTYNSESEQKQRSLHQVQIKKPIEVTAAHTGGDIGLDAILVNHALDKLNMDTLMHKIHHLVKMFGGIKYAFDLEWKIRLFTMEVLDHALI